MTRKELNDYIFEQLTPVVGGREARAMARIIMEDVAGLTMPRILCDGNIEVVPETENRILRIVARVKSGEPLQYVIGSAMFHGIRLTVSPGVLIPRPETSGLVDIICDLYREIPDLKVLDACTGSGAIAIALSRQLPFSQITATDFSLKALEIAKQNCTKLGIRNVRLIQDNILDSGSEITNQTFDIIVSNPPYVLECERASIDERVLNYEPSEALFVPDSNPLLFYKAIISMSLKQLTSGGRLFFEINPSQAKSIEILLADNDFVDIDIQRDFEGKQRYAIARKK